MLTRKYCAPMFYFMKGATRLLCIAIIAAFAAPSFADERAPHLREVYDALATKSQFERQDIVPTLPPDVQTALWTIHLKQFLVNHPELTVEQRSVIYEALGLLTSDVFERLRSTDAATRVAAEGEVDELGARAKLRMSRALGREALAQIGPPQVTPAIATNSAEPPGHGQPNDTCDCSIVSDYCWFGDCLYTFTCTRTPSGCGTLFRYRCDGLCP